MKRILGESMKVALTGIKNYSSKLKRIFPWHTDPTWYRFTALTTIINIAKTPRSVRENSQYRYFWLAWQWVHVSPIYALDPSSCIKDISIFIFKDISWGGVVYGIRCILILEIIQIGLNFFFICLHVCPSRYCVSFRYKHVKHVGLKGAGTNLLWLEKDLRLRGYLTMKEINEPPSFTVHDDVSKDHVVSPTHTISCECIEVQVHSKYN